MVSVGSDVQHLNPDQLINCTFRLRLLMMRGVSRLLSQSTKLHLHCLDLLAKARL